MRSLFRFFQVSFCLVGGLAILSASCQASEEPRQKTPKLTAKNFVAELAPGLNLGNTLEAIPKETSWGNPPPTEAFMVGARKAGFRSIRIPASWSQYADADHTIDKEWMANVTRVVQMARKAGLYVMLNIHWDGGWLQPTYADREKVEAKFRKFWEQIATNFRDFDEGLLFAGTNEVHIEGNYGPPTPENAEVQNSFNQTFVTTVRKTGGKNAARFLVVQTYNTDIDHGLKVNMDLPKDTVKGRLAMEVHYYSPYHFVMNDKSDVWQWGANATDPKATDTWGNEDYVDEKFQAMKKAFVDRGVPVVLGEYSAFLKPRFPGMKKYVLDWTGYVTGSAVRHGMVPMLWDIGLEGGILNRTTGAVLDKDLLQSIVKEAKIR